MEESTTLRRKCYSSKAVPCPSPKPGEMWSTSIFSVLSFYGINLRIMRTELKMGVVIHVADEVSFDEVPRTAHGE